MRQQVYDVGVLDFERRQRENGQAMWTSKLIKILLLEPRQIYVDLTMCESTLEDTII